MGPSTTFAMLSTHASREYLVSKSPQSRVLQLMGHMSECVDTEQCCSQYLGNDTSLTTPSAKPPDRPSDDPPNAFTLFGSTLVKAQFSTESLVISDDMMCEIVTDAWRSLTPDDRSRIEDEAERVEELHLAMLASHSKTTKGPKHRKKYWKFTSRITDFWLERWKEVQGQGAKHLALVGKGFLGINFGAVQGVSLV